MFGGAVSDVVARHDASGGLDRPIRVLIVDDEPLARQRLAVLLAGEPGVEVVGECANGLEALREITSAHPDLVFLDVQMPELDGLGVVEALGDGEAPEIVFVTAYSQYMERAFELHALDYLRKPYTNSRFQSALAHARRRLRAGPTDSNPAPESSTSPAHRHAALLASVTDARDTSRIAVQDQRTRTWHIIARDEIEWIDAADGTGHVCVHFGRETSLWRRTLAELEKELAPHGFLRVHRSSIVNTRRIRQVKPLQKGEYAITLANGTMLDTGRRYHDVVEEFLRGSGGHAINRGER